MTAYFFILGRNPELSRAEIYSYLEMNSAEFTEILFKENYLVVETNFSKFNVQDFGGVLKLGKIMFKGNYNDFRKFLQKDEIVPSDKFTWAIYGNFPEAEDLLIDKFKADKKKAMIRRGGKEMTLQDGEVVEVANAEFELFCFFQTELLLGLVEQDYSYEDIKERDMKKPVRRESLAISPRLAKILVNLSQVKKGETLLDAFCGVGIILQEALLKGINVIGVDIDEEAIKGANENMLWLKKNYKIDSSYQFISADSAKTHLNFNGIASETALGELLKQKVSKEDAEDMILRFENHIIPILRNLKHQKPKNAKIAITFPFVREYSVNIEDICRETGLDVYRLNNVKFPIKEFRKDQFISREFFVFV